MTPQGYEIRGVGNRRSDDHLAIYVVLLPKIRIVVPVSKLCIDPYFSDFWPRDVIQILVDIVGVGVMVGISKDDILLGYGKVRVWKQHSEINVPCVGEVLVAGPVSHVAKLEKGHVLGNATNCEVTINEPKNCINRKKFNQKFHKKTLDKDKLIKSPIKNYQH